MIRSGKPVAKASAILAVSGGLMATISGPSFASASDVSRPAARSAIADAAPTVARAGTVAPTFGEIDFTGVKASADQSASDLRRQSDAARASRSHERQAVADRAKELKRTKAAEAKRQAAADRAKELKRTQAAEAKRQAAADRAQELKAERDRQAAATQQAERDRQAAATQQAEAPRAEAPKQESNPAPAPSHSGVLGIAAQYTGIMYVYGGTTPAGFDCSGYTSFVFAKVGINLPRTAAQQQNATTRVSSPRPGDLVFMGFPAHHVGIYAGGGMMYDSGRPGTLTQLRAIFYGSGPVSYGRV